MNEEIKTAEEYLRDKYGAYRGSFSWRHEDAAYNAGVQNASAYCAALASQTPAPTMSQFANKADYLAALASQAPALEIFVMNQGGTGEFFAHDWKVKPYDGMKLYTTPQPDRVAELEAEIEALKAQVAEHQAREQWIHDNAASRGDGKGFTVSFFVPVDHEDIFCGIDDAIAALEVKP